MGKVSSGQNGAKTLPDGVAHTDKAYIREYPPPPLGKCHERSLNFRRLYRGSKNDSKLGYHEGMICESWISDTARVRFISLQQN